MWGILGDVNGMLVESVWLIVVTIFRWHRGAGGTAAGGECGAAAGGECGTVAGGECGTAAGGGA